SESRQYEGTGIGLSLTKEIVELHGGSINVKSTPGYGSEFIIKMPLSKEQDQTESPGYQYDEIRELKNYMLSDFHGEDNRPAVPAGENPEKPLILFADDNSAMRDFIGEILGKEFRVITAVNGEDGLIRARETRPDLIISDLMMPVMDGYAFITELKKDRYMSSVPVILLTARAEMESKIEGLSIGADDYIHKPFDHAELIVRVRNLLSSRRAARELIDKQREIDSDFKQAALVQRTILTPKNLYDSIKGLEIDVRYIPMNGSISGDYYNISPLKNGIASVMIADASGHGVQAALSTMQLDLLNRDSLAESYPDKRMEHINRELVERLSSKNFFTGFLTHIHDDRVYYSSAAHPAQYLIRPADAEIIPLKTKGRIIGMLDSAVYDMKEEKAGKGDGLILFTDGIFEEFNNKGEEWGENYLKEFLSNNLARLAGSPVQDWGLMILAEMNSFRGDARINDDITIICLKWI
ncbi:MAG: SpoIIE family protein phosphatase, partial [Brevinematales bacterium]